MSGKVIQLKKPTPPTKRIRLLRLGPTTVSLVWVTPECSPKTETVSPTAKVKIFRIRHALMGGLYYVVHKSGFKLFALSRYTWHNGEYKRGWTPVQFGTAIYIEVVTDKHN